MFPKHRKSWYQSITSQAPRPAIQATISSSSSGLNWPAWPPAFWIDHHLAAVGVARRDPRAALAPLQRRLVTAQVQATQGHLVAVALDTLDLHQGGDGAFPRRAFSGCRGRRRLLGRAELDPVLDQGQVAGVELARVLAAGLAADQQAGLDFAGHDRRPAGAACQRRLVAAPGPGRPSCCCCCGTQYTTWPSTEKCRYPTTIPLPAQAHRRARASSLAPIAVGQCGGQRRWQGGRRQVHKDCHLLRRRQGGDGSGLRADEEPDPNQHHRRQHCKDRDVDTATLGNHLRGRRPVESCRLECRPARRGARPPSPLQSGDL